ncbi:MAG: amidophosphoribosyltransferase [Planctomycetales bacterium]|nr:amidophosphoribosyltransferase [Planctomycetales bacterium]
MTMGAECREACGLFGIAGHPDAALLTYYGLYALQHRGQESAGIASTGGQGIVHHRGMGLVADVFTAEILERLVNRVAIGHVRYSTTGSPVAVNAQPIVVNHAGGPIAVAHNGNLVNGAELRQELEARGSLFQTTTDSEVFLHLVARPEPGASAPAPAADPAGQPAVSLVERLDQALRRARGAFSLLFLTPRGMIAVRDPWGFRPLAIGRLGDATVVASETAALDLVEAEYVRDVEPGEIVSVSPDGKLSSRRFAGPAEPRPAPCLFEYVYFARPDSRVFGRNVHEIRKNLGRRLAREHPATADVVVPVPDSGNSAALGFSLESGIPLEQGFVRNHYVGRTFIEPEAGARLSEVEVKLNAVADAVRGKRLVVVDDSIVRGTTARSRVAQLRRAGAREIHLRISCPPHRFGCHYGIDFPDPRELIANERSLPEIAAFLGVESLGYLSVEGLREAAGVGPDSSCTACWTGDYRVPVPGPLDKGVLEGGSALRGAAVPRRSAPPRPKRVAP